MKPSVPPRNWKIRITDILQCIAKIRRYTKGYTFDDFQADEKTIDSVLRNLEIIVEAARHIPAAHIQQLGGKRVPETMWHHIDIHLFADALEPFAEKVFFHGQTVSYKYIPSHLAIPRTASSKSC